MMLQGIIRNSPGDAFRHHHHHRVKSVDCSQSMYYAELFSMYIVQLSRPSCPIDYFLQFVKGQV